MTARIRPPEFHAATGVDDWRVVFSGAGAHFRTGSLADGIALVDAIGAMDLEEAPRLDLRPDGVTVRLSTPTADGMLASDVDAARAISAAAASLGAVAEPSAVQDVQVSIDALVSTDVMPFWRAVLGYDERGHEDLVDPHASGPPFWFQDMAEPRPQRNRVHIDVSLAHDQAEARVAAGVAAGGRIVRDRAPTYWTLADPEGNEVDIATWVGRD
jgi:4a-hydroxytetrahydrobiopterin dehydratase